MLKNHGKILLGLRIIVLKQIFHIPLFKETGMIKEGNQMDKKRREIWNKSGGKCWYCGCDLLEKGWHADHFKPIRRNWWETTCLNPENENEENKVPTCPSCNIQKGSLNIEQFREKIANFINSLNQYHTQYAVAKRYGLVQETNVQVVFWFERTNNVDKCFVSSTGN